MLIYFKFYVEDVFIKDVLNQGLSIEWSGLVLFRRLSLYKHQVVLSIHIGELFSRVYREHTNFLFPFSQKQEIENLK